MFSPETLTSLSPAPGEEALVFAV